MELIERIKILEDKQAIQELTNSYLTAADQIDPEAMATHFTANGKLTSIMASGTITLENRQGIAEGFRQILAPLTTAYHMAGQLQIELNGDTATGVSYCFVTLVGSENDNKYVHKIWAVYADQYVLENGKWLISARTATVSWEEKNNLN